MLFEVKLEHHRRHTVLMEALHKLHGDDGIFKDPSPAEKAWLLKMHKERNVRLLVRHHDS